MGGVCLRPGHHRGCGGQRLPLSGECPGPQLPGSFPGVQTREALLPLPGLRGRVHFWRGPKPVPAPHSDPSADEGPKTRGPRPVVPCLVPGNVHHHVIAGPVGGRSRSQTKKGGLERVSPGLEEPIACVLSLCLPACIPRVCDMRMGRPGGQGDFGR